jgi:hypothetical protein
MTISTGNYDLLFNKLQSNGWTKRIILSEEIASMGVKLDPKTIPEITKRVSGAKYFVFNKYPFLGVILQHLKIYYYAKIEVGADTMAVDGSGNIYISTGFMKNLTDSQLAFVLCHEAMHIATMSLFRLDGRDQRLWNYATDAIINYNLMHDELEPPKIGIIPKKDGEVEFKDEQGIVLIKINVANMSAEVLYREMVKQLGIPPTPPKRIPRPGEIVRNKKGDKWGICVSVKGDKVVIRSLTKQEAGEILLERGSEEKIGYNP